MRYLRVTVLALGMLAALAILTPDRALAVVPANDNLAAAQAVPLGFNSGAFSNADATVQVADGESALLSGGSRSVWYKHTASSSGTHTVDTLGSNFDTVLGVYSGPASNPSFASLSFVGCDDDSGGNLTSRLSFAATSGTTYYFQARSFGGTPGLLNFRFGIIPANDNLASYQDASPPFNHLVNNLMATSEGGEIYCTFDFGGTVWYRVFGSDFSPRPISVTTFGSTVDTIVFVRPGPGANPTHAGLGTSVACNDDIPGVGVEAGVSFSPSYVQSYYIQVSGRGIGDIAIQAFYDLEGDFVDDSSDNCPATANGPREAGMPGIGNQADNDGDGVPGTQPPQGDDFGGDACDVDDDNDGKFDNEDGCRTRAEDYDDWDDGDGCPDADNDGDGICDQGLTSVSCLGSDFGRMLWKNPLPAQQDCRNVAEDIDSFHDADGCPEPDNDYDTFQDFADGCPGSDATAGPDGIADTGDEPVFYLTPYQSREDFDGVIDNDGCHDSPEDDYDGDSRGVLQGGLPLFRDQREALVLGTDPVRACAATATANDESGPDAWPPDFNDSQSVSITDVLFFKGQLNTNNGRFDFDGSGAVSITDVLFMKFYFNQTCGV